LIHGCFSVKYTEHFEVVTYYKGP